MSDVITIENVETLLRQLVSIESPYFHEENVMDFVKKWLDEHGIPAENHTYYEPKVTDFHGRNVVGEIDSGLPGPVIYLGGHLDTVSLCNGWTKPPFEGVVEDGYMYGVGTLDMKSGCAAIMLALEEFIKKGESFKGKIIYHFVSDEEGPFGLGTVFLIKDKKHNIAEEADFAIITEPSSGFTGVAHPCLCLGARGGYNYTIKVHGLSAHAATPRLGISAAAEASKIVCELEKIEPVRDDKLGESVPCVIRLESGGAACSVPDYAEIEIFHHTVRGESVDTIRRSIEKAIEDANLKGTAELTFRQSPAEGFDGGFMPYCTDENNEYLDLLKKDVKKVCDTEANIAYFQSIGDFNHIGGKLGIPTILLGADGDRFHSYDERVNLQSVLDVTRIISEFLSDALVK